MFLLFVFGDRRCLRFFVPLILSIRPPLLSICPPVLSIFDPRLVADAGGEKCASRSGCQGEQKRSCDPLSGDRGERGFHTTWFLAN
jgi:hypothetical protein